MDDKIAPWQIAIVPLCLTILLLAGSVRPFNGVSMVHLIMGIHFHH